MFKQKTKTLLRKKFQLSPAAESHGHDVGTTLAHLPMFLVVVHMTGSNSNSASISAPVGRQNIQLLQIRATSDHVYGEIKYQISLRKFLLNYRGQLNQKYKEANIGFSWIKRSCRRLIPSTLTHSKQFFYKSFYKLAIACILLLFKVATS